MEIFTRKVIELLWLSIEKISFFSNPNFKQSYFFIFFYNTRENLTI